MTDRTPLPRELRRVLAHLWHHHPVAAARIALDLVEDGVHGEAQLRALLPTCRLARSARKRRTVE